MIPTLIRSPLAAGASAVSSAAGASAVSYVAASSVAAGASAVSAALEPHAVSPNTIADARSIAKTFFFIIVYPSLTFSPQRPIPLIVLS